MASPQESVSMALFCDFENVALGVRDANYEKFDIKPVLEKLLLQGSIVVKKAYCDWDRYKGFKASMHEASFELIEIPHVRQTGKNSADIRLVVDALDLCYTKLHVDTFVIISGDSDFSPLVSKLRENAKKVIGVGVKNSTSDLLVANCDEFIFYDDLVREQQRAIAKRAAGAQPKRSSNEERPPKQDPEAKTEAKKAEAIGIAVETYEALASERGESGKIWASVLKSAIKRRKPDFTESYYGFRAFGNLLDEAPARGLLEVGRDEKSGAFVFRNPAATDLPRPADMSSIDEQVDVPQPRTAAQPALAPDEPTAISDAVPVSVNSQPNSQPNANVPGSGRNGKNRRNKGRNAQRQEYNAAPAEPVSAPLVSDARAETPEIRETSGMPETPSTLGDVSLSPSDVIAAVEMSVPSQPAPNARAGAGRHSRARRSQAWTGGTMDLLESVDTTADAANTPAQPARDVRAGTLVDAHRTSDAEAHGVPSDPSDAAAASAPLADVTEKRSPARRGRRTAAGKIDAVVVPTLLEEAPTPQTVLGEDGSPRKAKPAARARRLRKAIDESA